MRLTKKLTYMLAQGVALGVISGSLLFAQDRPSTPFGISSSLSPAFGSGAGGENSINDLAPSSLDGGLDPIIRQGNANPVPVLDDLPSTRVIPNATSRFSPRQRVARLSRGNKVLEISNEAFRESGILEKAIAATPEVALSYQEFESQTLQRQQVEFQQQVASAAQLDASQQQSIATAVQQVQQTQQLAAQNFENALWNYGFNGAKVASVTSNNMFGRPSTNYVLLDAIGSDDASNLGYTITSIDSVGQFGATFVPSEYLLPIPVDPNDLFFSPLFASSSQRAPDGLMLMMTDDKSTNPVLQLLALPRFGFRYDTSILAAGDASFPERVSLLSRRASGAGQVSFIQEDEFMLPFDMAVNTQVLDMGGGTSGQFFVTANNDRDLGELDVATIGVRAYVRRRGSRFEGWSLVAGKKQSLFGAIELRPQGLEASRSLVGTVDRTNDDRAQLAIHAPLSDLLTWKVAIEDPDLGDLQIMPTIMGATRLQRWPTLATNVTFKDPDSDDQIVLGGLVRTLGFEIDATRREEFTTGWGLSAIGKMTSGSDSIFAGVAGGNGVGDYIRGIKVSAIGRPTSIESVSSVGAFGGWHSVFTDQCNVPYAEMNLAYGYGWMEDVQDVSRTNNRKLHQFWANYVRFLGDRVGVGAEYQYGYRQDLTGDQGENHQLTFMLAVRSGQVAKSTTVREYDLIDEGYQNSPNPGVGLDSDLQSSGVANFNDSIYPNASVFGATLDQRPLRAVVEQTQLGGDTFRQSL
ncbi:hypothetical protein [Stieleria varia]|uniref:Uncharacterized protein n=1 Tax=Stieleria varia TaxID=2528005 RepID=A0A5C6B8H7_9BACT|nr:hypothetical protein [Stieleria varia]TWU07942.1 hypothetical protein Pla52n_05190 [Stieleria varia]